MVIQLERSIPEWAEPLQRPARHKGASGGRGSGKSHFFAEEAVERAVCKPDLRMVCIREVQRSLKFSAKSLIESKIQKLGVSEHFDILNTEIRNRHSGGVIIFEGMQDHTADSIKSLEAFDVAWVEEAQSISQRSLDLLIPTIRADGSELWYSWNPESPSDPIDAFFESKPQGSLRVHTTYLDNPFCPQVLKDEAERLKAADSEKYDHIWMGGYFLGGNGRVYSSFKNRPFPDGNIDETVKDYGGDLYIGQDFNVNPMSSVIAQKVVDECHVLDSLELATSNTEEMASEIRRRYPTRRIIFCPDPAGNQRHTNAPAGQTDFTILKRYGFEVRAPKAHPPVVDRINNVQTMCLDIDTQRRRVRISPKAKALITGLSNQTYKEGTSIQDKNSGFDHICDAFGYLLWQEFNVLATRPSVRMTSLSI